MEYDNKDPKKRSLPNPLKVENYFLFGTSAVLLVIAITVVLIVRRYTEQDPARVAKGTFTAFLILVAAIGLTGFALTQLKFFFGASEPRDLSAKELRDLLEQGDLHAHEPTGPLNGLLYTWVEHLIDAPAEIQHLAQLQFRNGAAMVALFLSLTLTVTIGKVGVSDAAWPVISSWVGTVFLMLATYLLTVASPWRRLDRSHIVTSRGGLAFLILLPLLGPVLATLLGSMGAQNWFSVFPGAFVVLLVAIAMYWMFFYALMGDLPARPSREVSSIQQMWSTHCPPIQIMNNLDRFLRERIASRRYIWTDPKIDLNTPAGDFLGEAAVETEPGSIAKESPQFLDAWAHPERKRIVLLDIAGAVLVITGAILFAVRAVQPTSSVFSNGAALIVYGAIFATLGGFALRAGHSIWSRFDFESRALRMTLSGHYVSNDLQVGSKDATIKTNSKLVQSESMTFRLWATRLHTVTYGRRGRRYVMHMMGESELVSDLTRHLHSFAEQHASIVSPSSEADRLRHAQRLSMTLQSPRDAIAAPRSDASADAGSTSRLAAESETARSQRFCGACGAVVDRGDAFCRSCGRPQSKIG